MASCLQHLRQCQRLLLFEQSAAVEGLAATATTASAAAAWSPLVAAALDGDPSPRATAAIIAICIALVLFAGIMAGLTLGLLSLDRQGAGCPALPGHYFRAEAPPGTPFHA